MDELEQIEDISEDAKQLIKYAGLWRELLSDDETDTGYQE